MYLRAVVVALSACATDTVTHVQMLDETCPAPDPAADNRAAFQCALDRGELDLRGLSGTYYVDTPRWPRPYGVLVMPEGSKIVGDGAVTIAFRGDPMGHDWRGIQAGNTTAIDGVKLAVEATTGTWDEQSHVVEVLPSTVGVRIANVEFDYPVTPGLSRGDCVRIRCYPDQRCWDIEIAHSDMTSCSRSGIAVYAGLHGSWLPDGHCSTRFHHNTFMAPDQDIDFEGGGDNGGIDDNDCVEIDHNTHHLPPPGVIQSSLAVSLYPGSVWFHHNKLLGRGLDLMGGSHLVERNVITQTASTTDPVVYVRKQGTTRLRGNHLTREVSAGPGVVFAAQWKFAAPVVELDGDHIYQRTRASSLYFSGAGGVTLRDLMIEDTGLPGVRDAIRVEGAAYTSGAMGGPVVVEDVTLSGAFRSGLFVTGSHAGASEVIVRDSAVAVLCDNVSATATRGGISGPVLPATQGCP